MLLNGDACKFNNFLPFSFECYYILDLWEGGGRLTYPVTATATVSTYTNRNESYLAYTVLYNTRYAVVDTYIRYNTYQVDLK